MVTRVKQVDPSDAILNRPRTNKATDIEAFYDPRRYMTIAFEKGRLGQSWERFAKGMNATHGEPAPVLLTDTTSSIDPVWRPTYGSNPFPLIEPNPLTDDNKNNTLHYPKSVVFLEGSHQHKNPYRSIGAGFVGYAGIGKRIALEAMRKAHAQRAYETWMWNPTFAYAPHHVLGYHGIKWMLEDGYPFLVREVLDPKAKLNHQQRLKSKWLRNHLS